MTCLKVFKKRAPVIKFGCNREGLTGDGGKFFHEEVKSLSVQKPKLLVERTERKADFPLNVMLK
jgi:hypothetical protein